MSPIRKFTSRFLIAAAFVFSGVHAAEAEAAPKTLEEQIQYLEGALAESLRARDFAMLGMAVDGFKGTGRTGKDLELSILRAERNAAWEGGQAFGFGSMSAPAASMEAWGLMARARLGNEQALQTLRKLADENPAVPEPIPQINKAAAAEYLARKKANDEYTATVAKRGHALLALALLKEPGIQEKALAVLRSKRAPAGNPGFMWGAMGGGTDPVLLAILQADVDAGLNKLIEYCSDEKYAAQDQAQVLVGLNGLQPAGGHVMADEKFSILGEIRQLMPKDLQQKLIPPYVGILKRYTPETKQGWDSTLQSIANFGQALPAKSLPAEGVAAMAALLEKIPGPREQYPKQVFHGILKKQGKDMDAPVPPPKAPDF